MGLPGGPGGGLGSAEADAALDVCTEPVLLLAVPSEELFSAGADGDPNVWVDAS